jgi:hypothetical protein
MTLEGGCRMCHRGSGLSGRHYYLGDVFFELTFRQQCGCSSPDGVRSKGVAVCGRARQAAKKGPGSDVPTVELDRCHLYRSDVPDALHDLDLFEQQVHPHFRRSSN